MRNRLFRYPVIITGACCSALVTHVASADQPGAVAISTSDMLTVFLGLGLVLLIIFGCAWLVKRGTGLHGTAGGAIKVISVLPVGTRERIALVEIGGKQLLLGVTAAQINLLHTFDEPVVDAAQGKNNSEFAQKLHQFMSRN